MRAVKRSVLVAVLASAFAALSVPMLGLHRGDAHSITDAAAGLHSRPDTSRVLDSPPPILPQPETAQENNAAAVVSKERIPVEILKALGLSRVASPKTASERIAKRLRNRNSAASTGREVTIQSGEPVVLDSRSSLSAALITTIGGRDNQFSELTLLADWDGREDCTADREQKIDDFSFVESEIDVTLLRSAISEHTVANGFTENVYYYGDSVGNFWIGTDLGPGVNTSAAGSVDTVTQVNIPELINDPSHASGGITLLNPTSPDCADDQVAVTGIAVNPVADLADFGLCGTTGEIVYVSVLDTESCASNTAGAPIRTRILAFAFTDLNGTGMVQQGVRQILRNTLSNVAGVSVDDDGNLYFQLVDLLNVSSAALGGAIFKATEIPHATPGCAVNPRINRSIRIIPTVSLTMTMGIIDTTNGVRIANYSGTSPTFGNIVSISSGPCNVLYAAVARSFVATGAGFERFTEGPFTAPAAFAQGLPSMIISFADCSGGFDSCTSPAPGLLGTLPIGDGIADVQPATPGTATTRVAGVNNFRLFVQGDGPDVTGRVAGNAVISSSSPANTIAPVVGFQVDFSLHSGIAVNEQGTVFVISGGTPAGIGSNPSPMLSEILCFEDMCPMNRRADFVDLRGNGVPNPPNSGGNVGDGDSDRFDHIFYQAPLDQVTLTPGGLAGLARGFLRYTNRLAPTPLGSGSTLGVTKAVQNDDDSDGTIIFENLDPGHQVAGGDDQNFPNRGDDNDGLGMPALSGLYSGGFEFTLGNGTGNILICVRNGFFLNSNGNITFGVGDTDNTPTVPELRTGPPRIAPAWVDLNPSARAVDPINFPVQALGFANVNDFRIRWLNVPEFDSEGCATNIFGLGGNTFSIDLFDDGTGSGAFSADENNSHAADLANPIGNNAVPFDFTEGPTDLRFVTEPTTGTTIGCSSRPNGSGIFSFEYCRMELLGTPVSNHTVIAGYSIGFLSPFAELGLCEINLSTAAATAETNPFGVIQGTTAAFCSCCLGEGTEPTLFELFNEGSGPDIGPIGQITFATPDFDLRFEGNDAQLCTPIRQRDNNRGKICFLGAGCNPPANPQCLTVTPVGTVAVAPGQPAVGSAAAGSQRDANGNRIATPTSGIINAICQVQLNILGCGFFPNETTIVCQGFGAESLPPLQRSGKVVSTAVTLACDFNGDGINEAVIALASVTPVNCNLVRATVVPPSGGAQGQLLNCSGFPAACCGGLARLTVTTAVTSGDNNIFGPFTRATFCTIDLGIRAPVVFSVTPSSGPCAILEDVLITGACFCLPDGSPNVTSVFAVEKTATNPVTVQATGFKIVNCSLIDAEFAFTSANTGKTFLIFVSGPNGTSRNVSTAVAGNVGCPASSNGGLGNEQCIQVLFTCTEGVACPTGIPLPGCPCPSGVPAGTNGCVATPVDVALVNGCNPMRDDSGALSLDVFGRNLKADAQVTVGGISPRRIKPREPDPSSSGGFLRLTLKGRICNGLPGVIIVTNPSPAPGVPPQPSQPFVCTERCATN